MDNAYRRLGRARRGHRGIAIVASRRARGARLFRRGARRAPARRRGRAGARRARLLHGAEHRQARHPRPEDGQGRRDRAGAAVVAARRDRRSRRRPVDHRQRPERDRARRSRHARGEALAAAAGDGLREPQHGDLRPEGPDLVHGPDRHLRPPRPRDERRQGVAGAARPRAVRHRDDAGRRRLLRVARRQPHRARSTSRRARRP